MMEGIHISQARAEELSHEFEIYFQTMTGFYVRTDNLSDYDYTYHIYRTGDHAVTIPNNAHRFVFEITLAEAARNYGVPYPTLAEWAREGKLDARKSAGTWLTTPQAIEQLINS